MSEEAQAAEVTAPIDDSGSQPTEKDKVEQESARERMVKSIAAKVAAQSHGSATEEAPESATTEAETPEEPSAETKAEAKPPYTPDELAAFAERGGLDAHDLDKDRVPPETMALWKRLDRHYKVKLQALAQERDAKGKFKPQQPETATEAAKDLAEYERAIELINDPESRAEGIKALFKTGAGKEAVAEILADLGLDLAEVRTTTETTKLERALVAATKQVPELDDESFLNEAIERAGEDPVLSQMLQSPDVATLTFALETAANKVRTDAGYIARKQKDEESRKAKEQAEEAKRQKEAANRVAPGSKAAISTRRSAPPPQTFDDKLRASVQRNYDAVASRRR